MPNAVSKTETSIHVVNNEYLLSLLTAAFVFCNSCKLKCKYNKLTSPPPTPTPRLILLCSL